MRDDAYAPLFVVHNDHAMEAVLMEEFHARG